MNVSVIKVIRAIIQTRIKCRMLSVQLSYLNSVRRCQAEAIILIKVES